MVTKVVYQTEARAAGGGRDGISGTTDGHFAVKLTVPKEMGGPGGEGVNPEQLFAAGYAACFGSALQHAIRARRLNLPAPDVQATVGIGRNEANNFQLEVHLVSIIDTDDAALAESITQEAHQVCPYSHATRGNITVTLESRTR